VFPISPNRLRRAYALAMTCADKLGEWPGLEALAREAIERVPEPSHAYYRLGEALMRQERTAEAEAALQTAIELNPAEQEAPMLLQLCRSRSQAPSKRPRVAPWPGRQTQFEDYRALLRTYVLPRRGAPLVEPDSVFMTLGSCFAQHLARQLRETGRTVNSEEIGEEVNSTFANRYLLEWIENGPTDSITEAVQAAYGPAMRERMRAKIIDSDVFVITLGVGACFFQNDTGDFAFVVSKSEIAREYLMTDCAMRMTSVAENVDNIRRMMASIGRLARRTPKFVLTVSPVPLGGTTERNSAVLADCVSKSVLRLAAEEVCAAPGEHQVIYWPSFEMVRWLGPHFGPGQPQVFGAEDANSRHVSAWLVRLVIELFLEHHASHSAEAAAE
jgi:hypothetical protein